VLFRVGEENPLMVFVVHRETGRSTRGDIPYVKKKKKKESFRIFVKLGGDLPWC
jgi:hypothetical protein